MSYYEFTIRISDAFKDMLIQRLSHAGCLGMIENDESLVAYFPETLDIETAENDLAILKKLLEKAGRGDELSYEFVMIPEKDWNESWKKDFKPVDVGDRFTIIPPWENKRDGRINLIIDPGMAFGTGHHETTRSCIVLMEKYSAASGKDNFLDLGTGTGVLAIAAAKLGFQRVVGIDTDILATDAASQNCVINGVPSIEIREGSIDDTGETFDLIAANLISGVLVELAPSLAAHLRTNGKAILSGILNGQQNEVIEAMRRSKLTVEEIYYDGKWASLVVKRPFA